MPAVLRARQAVARHAGVGGGALALENLFGWNLWFAVIALGIVSGMWAIYGGLSSVAWTDLLTVVVMILGGLTVTFLVSTRWPAMMDRWSMVFAR